MKVTNVMNFVRTYEPRDEKTEKILFKTTKEQLQLCLDMNIPATFLLEYDALCKDEYVNFFKTVDSSIELGLWYEIVEPLTLDIGVPYRSERGYKWDWGICPGYSMSYTQDVKEKLIDKAMEKFKATFGYYPRTVGAWVLDTYTVNYLTEHYDIDALAICRDQINTDAYTLVGGYFNGLYFPSKNNVFTPAQTAELQNTTPVVRLLGPDPIHNYDSAKYFSESSSRVRVYTLEPACEGGANPEIVDWFFDCYYDTESIGLNYTQVGQENSFGYVDIITPLRKQFEKLKERGVKFEKMSDTGATFKKEYALTPPASVSALKNWDTADCQTVYYSCKNYVCNLLRFENYVTIRALYLFDERIRDTYLDNLCDTFDSIHENLPIVDTFPQRGNTDGGKGIILDTGATQLTLKGENDEKLTVSFGDKKVVFTEDCITLENCSFSFTPKMVNTKIDNTDSSLEYEYKGHVYSLSVEGGRVEKSKDGYTVESDKILLTPTKK